jgi:hypothetical protein
MSRSLRIAGAQMGPTQRADTRAQTLARMIALLDRGADAGARLVVFPELAFTTFFPRWLLTEGELDAFFETSMPGPQTAALFERARARGIALWVGYAERTPAGQRFNAATLTAPDGSTLLHYRKIHLPGSAEPRPGARFQQLEKRYFAYGDQGFPVVRAASLGGAVIGTMICNDRRWPEAWRVLGLGGVELVLLGYNSAAYDPNGGEGEDAALRTFHSQLVVQANAYMNATWAVAVAKAGEEDGAGLIGGSCIVDPQGRIVAEARTLADEVMVADCDLDACLQGKTKMFDFAAHRRPQWYGPITEQVGATPPH